MFGLLNGVVMASATRSARAILAELMTTLGASGLDAAARSPGLLALVDQHAAAVRDALPAPAGAGYVIALAGYAEGVRDAAVEHGWQPATSAADWTCPDWVPTRLLAVCALARAAGN